MRNPASTSLGRIRAAVALACLLAYAGTLRGRDFIRDDAALIRDNPLLHQGLRAVPELLSTGYWEAPNGSSAPVQEYRPLLSLTFLFHVLTTGNAQWPMRAANVLLHALVCLLLLEAMRRRMPLAAATAAALAFALIPIQTEAVSFVTSRSELLSAAFMLGAWIVLDENVQGKNILLGTSLFGAGLLTKEHSLLFPLFLGISDWTFHGWKPWEKRRRRAYAALFACAAAYFALRWALLGKPLHGGFPYFTGSRLVAALTYSRFALAHYLRPALTGAGLCSDYTRPLIPDSSPFSPAAWACLLALAGLYAGAGYALLRRARWAFWVVGPSLFLLPTCHLIIPLDTLGAERFMYMPSIAIAAGLGSLFSWAQGRRRLWARAALACLLAWYAASTIVRTRIWLSDVDFFQAACACNPVSAHARSGLGVALLTRGRREEGRLALWESIHLDPAMASSYFNLAREAWDRGDRAAAEPLVRRCLAVDPGLSDAWILLSLVEEWHGRPREEALALRRALQIMPWNPVAQFDLGRLELMAGRPAEAVAHFSEYLRYAPRDPDAGHVAALIAEIKAKNPEVK